MTKLFILLICFLMLCSCMPKEYYIDLGKDDVIVVPAQDGTDRNVIIKINRE